GLQAIFNALVVWNFPKAQPERVAHAGLTLLRRTLGLSPHRHSAGDSNTDQRRGARSGYSNSHGNSPPTANASTSLSGTAVPSRVRMEFEPGNKARRWVQLAEGPDA